MRFVAVVGLSGAGKSQAMKSFEDLGFYCCDNLAPAMAPQLVELARGAGHDKIALALDVRTHGPFGEALAALRALQAGGHEFELLYLEASDAAIVRRYSETRRRHPFEGIGLSLPEAIARERIELETLRAHADRVWDTSSLTQGTLKSRVIATYALDPREHSLGVNVVAFGFKYGVPLDADLLFDVRFLPNPNYVPELSSLSGRDAAVAAFLEAQPATNDFLQRLFSLIDFLVPHYANEAKARLTIAIGCTGGRHRSVYVARRLASHLREREDIAVALEFRELALA